jgi:2-dehydropantoate 2-reductase
MAAKILLVGIGGVGSIAAYTLQANGAEVSAVARSAYDVLTQDGFTIESVDYGKIENFKPDYVFKSAEEAVASRGIFDYIVITTKNIPDVSPVEKMIENAYNKDSTIVLLENGVGIERSMFNAYPDATVISGVTMISSTLYGTTIKHVGPDIVSFGPYINETLDKDSQIEKAKKFVNLYYNDKNKAKYDENVKYIRWRKLIYNAAINTTCAITNVDAGRLEIFGGMDKIVRPAMKEVIAIAKADGVELPEDIIDFMIRSDDGEYYPPSMLIDIRKNQYTEYKTIVGTALDIAAEKGVAAPVLTILCDLLEVIQFRTMESRGKIALPEKRPLPSDNFKLTFLD